jgi:hypothetical protein
MTRSIGPAAPATDTRNIKRSRQDDLAEAHTVQQRRSERDMAEASRRGRLLQSEPEKPLPDVPLQKRGFGVMDEAVPHTIPTPGRRGRHERARVRDVKNWCCGRVIDRR